MTSQEPGPSRQDHTQIIVNPQNQFFSQEKMVDFLSNQDDYECKLRILNSKVVQKSYGRERRYFCPPPCIYLTGNGWELKNQRTQSSHGSSEIIGSISNGTENAEWLPLCPFPGLFTARKLCISAADNQQNLELKVNFSYSCGLQIGQFLSKQIKVISKPPTEKKYIRETDCKDMFIESGSKVALFSPRSQLGSTSYLYIENERFQASTMMWKAFTVHLFDETDPNTAKEGYIHYGSVVKLVDGISGIAFPELRVRKVENDYKILNASCSGEPLSQLHTCALEMVNNERTYLSRNREHIVPVQADPDKDNHHKITDAAVWTLVSAVETDYRFYEAMGPVVTPLTPCAVADSIEVAKDSHFELSGQNFTPNLKVWFAATEAETLFKSEQKISCKIPTSEQLKKDTSAVRFLTMGGYQVPITLVREDGIIYPTNLTYSFK